MDNQPVNKVEQLANISRILGIMSVGILILAALLLVYARFILGDSDWISGIGYVIFALLMLFISLILGLSASITALIALNRNKDGGDDPMIRKLANLGLTLGLASVLLILIFFAVTWIVSSGNPPPDISTPIPATVVP
jgi:hypothetical protein